uniref:Carbonic anhydrase n=1 Tax=Canis lupus familiaris TaxID=9615 RepID=A0A8C0MT03_CANLF
GVVLSRDPTGYRQFHLHWGASDDHGSEHTVDGVKYAAELHLVHWNPKYNTYGEALKQPDGIAVVGIFLKIGREKGEFQLFLMHWTKLRQRARRRPSTKFDPSCLFPACRGLLDLPRLLHHTALRGVHRVDPAEGAP